LFEFDAVVGLVLASLILELCYLMFGGLLKAQIAGLEDNKNLLCETKTAHGSSLW